MKQLLLLFAILLGYSRLFAQSYIPIPDTLAVWTQVIVYDFAPYDSYTKCQVFTAEKIQIDSLRYTVLRSSGVRKQFMQTETAFTNEFLGLFRNDTVARKVYYRHDTNSQEMLMYDFTLQVGDAIPPSVGNNWTNVIDEIDFVFMGDNIHRRWRFADYTFIPGAVGNIVEGVGSMRGLGWDLTMPYEPAYSELECFSYKDSSWQTSLNAGGVYTPTSCWRYTDISEPENVTAKVFPNPAGSFIEVQYAGTGKPAEFTVTDLSGKQVLLQQLNQQPATVNTQPLSPGIYIWTVSEKGIAKTTDKMIKE